MLDDCKCYNSLEMGLKHRAGIKNGKVIRLYKIGHGNNHTYPQYSDTVKGLTRQGKCSAITTETTFMIS